MSLLRLACGRAPAEVVAALDAIEAHLSSAGARPAEALQWRLVAEEIFTNIARCAWPDGEARHFTIELSAAEAGGSLDIAMTTIDDGMPFDPTGRDPPSLDESLEQRDIGGLGMFLLREMTDAQRYARIDGENRLHVARQFPR